MDVYLNRREKLQEKMRLNRMDGFIMTQNVDIYYFTGTMQTGFLFIPSEGEAVFYVRRSVIRAQMESRVDIEELGSMRSLGERLRNRHPRLFANGEQPVIATEFDVLPVQTYHKLQSAVPAAQWKDGSMIVRETRMIKGPEELDIIRRAAAVTDLALERAAAEARIGMKDVELMSLIETTIRENGHMGLMRMRSYNQEVITGMVGSGGAMAVPTYFDGPAGGQGLSPASPQSAGSKTIGPNEPILIDIGCCIDGYVFDQTRTMVIGELDEPLDKAYQVAEHILRRTEDKLVPGTACEQLYIQSLEIAGEAGLGDHFMGYGKDQVKFLGHGIGLEIDELPILARGFSLPLEPGMVIAIEPKFTFPGRGVVGIENSYLITEDGFEKLSISREGLIRLER
ncbi:Xaa-Pro peptidase family protein [Paenibacillus sp. J2TS4]|uniref:M24 family metallopeptidase n=1 Tax=Paenibacillus sp. J2TS4 TaxID=2807194 RepID=UPI001B0E57BA|nr:Xaa-Pro peptidase family protein [Paenibacillus sp. J2TS4]GIP35444.1 peptidase M24 [Paenibacillus sp. J2TS4]